MRSPSLIVCLFLFFQSCTGIDRESGTPAGASLPKLEVSSNHRYLQTTDGTPFFWLGDTAWELFHRLNQEEADLYLQDRAKKGFTVIQAVVLAELDGLHTPNPYGHLPLIDDDPTQPNEAYFEHVDYIVDKPEALGMYIGMLPTWGDKFNKKWGVGPEIFTPENAAVFGEFLGKRYKDKAVIWILGGDRNPDTEEHLAIIRRMAQGLERGDEGKNLMTFHPQGRQNSAEWFHQDEWLDFNMIQSGHERPAKPNYQLTLENLALEPAKPTLDGEPCYEDHPVKGAIWKNRNEPGVVLPWFDEWDVRRAAYEAMLSGAFGHTYGHHSIWQMWLPKWEPLSIARTPWQEALHHPGSLHMKYFRSLFEARPFWKLRSDQSIVLGDNPEGTDHIRAGVAEDGSFAVIYIPTGKALSVNLTGISGEYVKGWWFNPRQNSSQLIGETLPKTERTFTPPTEGRNNDWVLILEDSAGEFDRIGSSYQHIVPAWEE